MKHSLNIAGRTMAIAILCLCSASMTTIGAQQAVQSAAPVTASAGPRLAPMMSSFEPSIGKSASRRDLLASNSSDHTLKLSTLALVVIGVVVLLLVLR